MASRSHDHGGTFTHKIQTGGEVTVNLILTIKLDSNGLSLSTMPASSSTHTIGMDDDDKVKFVVPDIQSEDIIQFGEQINEKGTE